MANKLQRNDQTMSPVTLVILPEDASVIFEKQADCTEMQSKHDFSSLK